MAATVADAVADAGGVQPVAPKERLDVLDALRGVALCGILLVNIQGMGWLLDASRPYFGQRVSGADVAAWWVDELLIEGTMRGLFSLLFGVGIILFLAKAERGDVSTGHAQTLMLRRLTWLFVFGVIDSTLLLWPGDILIIYAMAGLLVLPFWRASPRRLGAAAAAVILILSAWLAATQLPYRQIVAEGPRLEAQAASGARLDAPQQKMLDRWRHFEAGRPDDPEDVARQRAVRMGGYRENFVFMARKSWELFWDMATIRWVLDAAGFMLVGMLLFRLGWLQGQASRRTYLALVLVGYGLGIALRSADALTQWRNLTGGGAPGFPETLLGTAIKQPARLLVTLGHVGLFHLLWRTSPGLLRPFQPLGRMAFTGYLLQSLLAALAFSGFGLGLWGRFDLPALWVGAATIWIIEIAFAALWLSHFRMGPLEWVWRRLTYGRAVPKLRAVPTG